MADNSFQAFYEELKLLVEKFEKKQMQIKMESDLDYDSVKIFGEKMDSVTRAKLGVEDAAELAYTTCLLYTSPSPRDKRQSRMPSSA